MRSPRYIFNPLRSVTSIWIDVSFFGHMQEAAEKYFLELATSPALQGEILSRLNNLAQGGAIWVQE